MAKTKAAAAQESKKQADIKQSLIAQLVRKSADVSHYLSLLDDYLFYYAQEKKMHADVRKNGRIIKCISSTGKECDRENPAVKDAVLYNRQKLAILNALGLEAVGCKGRDENRKL